MRRLSRAVLYVAAPTAVYFLIISLAGCASAPPPTPTPERPLIGCIASSPFPARQKLSSGGSRLLPELVRVIGETPGEDGERWMVIRGTFLAGDCSGESLYDREKCDWYPFAKNEIQTGPGSCGAEANAIAGMQAPPPLP